MDTFTQQPEQDKRKLEDDKELSGLKFFSMGLVVRTPAEHPSTIIEVTPTEFLSIQETGPVEKKDTTYKQTHQDANGGFNSQKDVTKNNIIEAEWLPLSDSNRSTPPCVYKDESVMLFKYKDDPKYYWATIKHQPELRRKEMVRWSASNETSPLVPYTTQTSYYVEMDAIKRRLHIATPVNGEGVAFRVLMDVAASQMDVSDNQGNGFIIQSVSGKLTVFAKNNMEFNAGQKFTFNAPSFNVNSTDIKLNGETAIAKGLKIANGLAVAGGGGGKAMVLGGDLTVNGSLQARQIRGNSITEGGMTPADIPPMAAQVQSASQTTAPFTASASTPASAPSAVQSTLTPSAQTNKDLRYDYAATANKAPTVLTGDKFVDSPKLATGAIVPSVSYAIPGLSSIKETASKLAVPGQSLVSSGMSGLGGLADTARSIQDSVSQRISGATSGAMSAIQDGRMTVMDPINAVTRMVSTSTSSIVNMVQNPTSGLSNQVNGFLQPINNLSRMVGGKGLGSMNQLNAFNNKVYEITGKVYNINNVVGGQASKISSPIYSLTSKAGSAVNNASYAAVNIAEPLRVATDTVSSTNNAARSAKSQLEALSAQTSSVLPRDKTLDELL